MKITSLLTVCLLAWLSPAAQADTPQAIMNSYLGPGMQASATQGGLFFNARPNGDSIGCTSCHTDNPKALGKTRANKLIEPMAPVVNAGRFTDPAKVEKWFKRNCKDVLERACTDQEKADFIAFMLSIK